MAQLRTHSNGWPPSRGPELPTPTFARKSLLVLDMLGGRAVVLGNTLGNKRRKRRMCPGLEAHHASKRLTMAEPGAPSTSEDVGLGRFSCRPGSPVSRRNAGNWRPRRRLVELSCYSYA